MTEAKVEAMLRETDTASTGSAVIEESRLISEMLSALQDAYAVLSAESLDAVFAYAAVHGHSYRGPSVNLSKLRVAIARATQHASLMTAQTEDAKQSSRDASNPSHPAKVTEAMVEAAPLVFWYRNYKGEEGYRRARPISIRFGMSEWHKEPQWLLLADDLVNNKRREFAMRDMQSVIGTAALSLMHAGEAPGPSTLAADTTASASVSRRGEPAPVMPEREGEIGKVRCLKCAHVYPDADISAYIADGDTSGAHEEIPTCPKCGSDGEIIRDKAAPATPAHDIAKRERERCANQVPTTWLDPLLSGPSAVATFPDCRDVERLLQAIANRIQSLSPEPQPETGEGK